MYRALCAAASKVSFAIATHNVALRTRILRTYSSTIPADIRPVSVPFGTCTLKADASLATTELFRVDVFRHQAIAVGKSGRTEGIEKQLTHIPWRQG
jgi:hypothetical protein